MIRSTIPATPKPGELDARGLTLAYDKLVVVEELDVSITHGRITAIVGANACGKSTLLRGLSRLLKPTAGTVHLSGQDVHRMKTKHVALQMGLLPQSNQSPSAITVADLISRGRHPHQTWFAQWSAADEAAVTEAMRATRTTDLAERSVDELSGGQTQRVWIAMALAQETPIMLLDEPTTFLDMAHQVDVMDLLAELNGAHGRTIVIVLHDLNQACRYAHDLVAMKDGNVVAQGPPSEVVTESLVEDVFGLKTLIIEDPISGTPLVVPLGAGHRASNVLRCVPRR